MSKTPLAVQAYRVIHERIITMDLEPGQHLDEKQLINQLGMGRTPIREALLRLASDFLVETQPNKGFIVRPLAFQNIKTMFEALRILELGAASLAIHQDPIRYLPMMQEAQQKFKTAIKADDLLGLVWENYNFHMHFAYCSANEYLIRALKDVRNEANRLAYLSYRGKTGLNGNLKEHYKSVCTEHEQMMDYLKNKNLYRLKETIASHIQAFQQRVILYLTASAV
ncbi:MAG TPA: hypothetical protein DDW42_04260 [Desulfobacteraceae bacterium]|nr:hypothetical protein [Desulfobacteraceae bacterium]